MEEQCVCGSGKIPAKCCLRFLSGQLHPKTPEQLMRSRYCAYALGGRGEYLLSSWFTPTAKGITAAELSEKNCEWQKLVIIAKSQKGDKGWVEFKAYYANEQGEQLVLHEKSIFQRVHGRWFYVGAELLKEG